MATKLCKKCMQEMSSSSKKCPNCGKDQRNWFMRHKILTFLGIIVIIGVIGAANGGKSNNTAATDVNKDSASITKSASTTKASENVNTENTSKETTATEAPKTPKYSDGTYLVGKDIKSGLYRVTLKDEILHMGYIHRAKDVNMETDSIIANILLTGNGYVEIKSTDVAVKLQGVQIEPINIKDLKPEIKKEVTDGIYLVGYDLAPGTYKVEITDEATGMGYVERSKSVAMDVNDIIANDIQQGSGYVKIEKGDFAVRLQGVKLTFQK